MPANPISKGRKRAATVKRRPRPKLDPRLALILSLSGKRLKALKDQEEKALQHVGNEIRSTLRDLAQDVERTPDSTKLEKLRDLDSKLFAPITAGVYLASGTERRKRWPTSLREPYVSAFILSEASSRDLSRLGAKIRSQAGDIFTAFIPFSAIDKLEASPAIRYIELARPHFETLDEAVPLAQIDALHTASPPVTGAGVVVGVFDSALDIYHPDFRTAGGATRVSFLWDQTLDPASGAIYGVEYTQADIDAELAAFNSAAPNAYTTVRHGGAVAAHGTHVAGIAVGNGLGQAGTFTGAAPGANLIFVAHPNLFNTDLLSDSTFLADGFSYIFARAAALSLPCVVNMSNSDNQGPHDGSTLGEQFLDNLLLTPGRAITVSAGNSNGTACHAAGSVAEGSTVNLVLAYAAGATNSDDIEIWYDGHDRFSVTVTVPTVPATVIGPVTAGTDDSAVLPSGIQVQVTSVLNDARNNDNLISIIIIVPPGQTVPAGNWTFGLTGIVVINGRFQAWVDRNNRSPALVPKATWQAPFLQEDMLTLGVPATGRRVITVGNHDKTAPTPGIWNHSGRGPTRDGRTKPEIAAVGVSVEAPRSRDMNAAQPGGPYVVMTGTSMSAPLVAGACALLFECRGASATWANLKQILEDTARPALPSTGFGFGSMKMAAACAALPMNVDVWLRDDPADTGLEPFTGPVAWLSPDIEVLDSAGNPVPNPTHDPAKRFNNIIRITVRNRGTQTARNTEVYFYWADPATNIPYPAAWNTTGIYAGAPGFVNQTNMAVIPQLLAGASTPVDFAWAPPAPGGNLSGDDHFCLLVRLENEADPSRINAGGWSAIGSRNNVALRNVHVLPDDLGDAGMGFYMVGSPDQDSLVVLDQLEAGAIELSLPVQALPWRDIRVIEESGGQRPRYGGDGAKDPLLVKRARLKRAEIQLFTDIVGAAAIQFNEGVATIHMGDSPLFIPHVRIAEGARMPVRLRVREAKAARERRFVHVAQFSGGRRVGGVSLELRGRSRKRS